MIKSVKNPICFMLFLLVRIPARTPPLKSMATDPRISRRRPRHPHSIAVLRQDSPVHKLTLKVLTAKWFQNVQQEAEAGFRHLMTSRPPASPPPRQHNRTTATAKSKRLRSCASRPQCPPNKYPAPQIAVTQTAAPRKLKRANFRHGMCNAPASSAASTRIPKRNRARKTVAAPYRSKSSSRLAPASRHEQIRHAGSVRSADARRDAPEQNQFLHPPS